MCPWGRQLEPLHQATGQAGTATLCSVAAHGPRLQLPTQERVTVCARLLPRLQLRAALPLLGGRAPRLWCLGPGLPSTASDRAFQGFPGHQH